MSTSQGAAQYSLSYATINVKTNFQQPGVQETSTQIQVIRSLTLPDAVNSTYYFTYDCDSSSGNAACGSPSGQSAYYGELTGITFPTGGTASYFYSTYKDAYGNMNQRVNFYNSGANGGWSYIPKVLSTCSASQVNCQQQTTVSSPTGTTVYTFQLNNGAWPISIVTKDNEGNALSTVTNTWDFSQSCVLNYCHGASYVQLLSQQTTVPAPGGNLTKQTQYTYDSPQKGNRTAIKEWKYTSSGSFSSIPDRATYITYLTTGTNDINKPLSVTLCSNSGSDSACPGGGTRVSQSLYTYDAYGTNGLASITGIAQHDDTNFGSGYTTRGNATSVSLWVSGSSYLTTSYTYDTTGQVLTETDTALNTTHYGYSDSFFTDSGNGTTPSAYSPPKPTNALRTSVIDAIGTHTVGYYWGSGKTGVVTDYNGMSTYSHYQDGLDLQTEEIDPIGWKLATYSSVTQSDMYAAVGDASPSVGCSSCKHTQTILDSWGRTASQILVNNPIGQVNIDSSYDGAGRLQTETHPYSGASDPNHVYESYSYDGLNRTISVTHPDGQASLTAYGANVASYGGLTVQQGSTALYGYGYPQISQDEAGNQREQWLDGFGRIIEVDEPATTSGTRASATLSIQAGPAGQSMMTNPCKLPSDPCPQIVWNQGTVSLTVNGYTASAGYGYDGTVFTAAADVASGLASGFNNDPNSPVTASSNGASLLITAKGPGVSGNFSFSSSGTHNFKGASFSVSPASGALSGGSGGIASSLYATNYFYDAVGNLTKVVQGSQTRTFAYDGLDRKVSETTPEGGTVTYAYVMSGGGFCSGDPSNVCQRTDARGVVSAYTYDHTNRLTGVKYTIPAGIGIASMPNACTTTPNGTSANVCYYYDQGGARTYAIGRMTGMADPTGSESYNHDADGRVTQLSKLISGQTYTIGYQYNAGGDVTQITYPSGRTVYQAYNAVGQLCQISPSASGCSGSGYYAGGFSYNAPGQLAGFSYGNGVAAALGYSAPRAQLSSLTYARGTQSYFSLGYWYQRNSGNCPNGTVGNNGSIQCITDNMNGGRTVNYGYDALGRMLAAKTNGSAGFPQWGLSESYDRYGNRLSQAVTAGSGPSSSLSFNSNNQPTGYTFDASGNMTVEPLTSSNNMTYDGENRMTAFNGIGGAASYAYDGNGLRVVKSAQGGTTTVSVFAGDSVIAEYDNSAAPTAPSREYIYNPAGGATTGLLAMIGGGATTYYHQDHLSARLTTDGSGNILTQEGHLPFGDQWYQSGPGNKWLFTSYQQDSESGLDYALARYYNSRTGTFCSADPLAGNPSDPQSWNRYPYGRNDPINKNDPSGKFFALIGMLVAEMMPTIITATETVVVHATPTLLETVGTYTEAALPFAAAAGSLPLQPTGGGPQKPQQTPKQRFKDCNSQFGDANSQAHLTYNKFQMAANAANKAGIGTNQELALWDKEGSFNIPGLGANGLFPQNGAGALGPMQTTRSVLDLGKQLPRGWNSNPSANLLAGARYFARLINHYGFSASDGAAAAYLGGPHNANGVWSQALNDYQDDFNTKSAAMQKLTDCMKGGH
jgi:RHS repeat-associated protein